MKTIPSPILTEYFSEAFDSAKKKTKLKLSHATENYIIKMLSEYADGGKFLEDSKEPAGSMLEKVFRFRERGMDSLSHTFSKKVGDFNSFICGFFPEYLKSDFGLYLLIARKGYDIASTFPVEERKEYKEIVWKLPRIVDTITEIRDMENSPLEIDVPQSLEKYLKTGNQRLLKRLAESGVPVSLKWVKE